ncbi:hypothetical protein GCM10023334_029750 [Nonomuraea thailandensis]
MPQVRGQRHAVWGHGSASRGSRAVQLDAAAGAGAVVELDDELEELESDDLLSPDFDEDEEDAGDDEVEDDERLSVL